jgi:putative photosynthetic complex assembly protein 2
MFASHRPGEPGVTLTNHGLPILFTLFVWWFSTGAILYLDGLPRRTYRWSMLGATVVLLGALYALHQTAGDTGASGAYVAFAAAILVWGWVEMSFLMGLVTGSRRTPCPIGAQGWRRLRFAFEVIVHHELALLAGALLIAAATWGADNQLGLQAFVVLWLARLSTKLNLFLGVRNFSEEFLPDHLRYLQTYFTRKSMNPLFPFAVSVFSVGAGLLWHAAAGATDPGSATALSLLATLVSLAVLEHWFLILPINFGALWDWSLVSRRVAPPVARS